MKLDPKISTAHIILIHGDDSLQKLRGLKEVLAALGAENNDFDTESFSADQKHPLEWLAISSQFPLFGDSRIEIVRNLCRLEPKSIWPDVKKVDAKHPFVKEALTLQPHSKVILFADDETGETAEKRYARALPDWIKLVQACNGCVLDTTEKVSNPVAFVKDEANKLGKKISNPAAQTLIEMLNGVPAEIRSELGKLALYVGDTDEIREVDVRNVTTPDPQYNVFKLVDAIVDGKAASALEITKTVFAQANKIESEIFPSVFPMLMRQFRFLWQGKVILDQGESPGRISPSTREMLPVANNLLKNQEWMQKKVIQSARNVSLHKLTTCFEILVDADAKMKGQRFASAPTETIEQMVLRLCTVFAR